MVRGRKPKPLELKVIEGNPGHRPIPSDTPKPKPIAPHWPTWLSSAAKVEWKRVAPLLEEMGLLTQIDQAALASYCQSWARVEQCTRVLDAKGLTYESRRAVRTGPVETDDDGDQVETGIETVLIKSRPEVVMEQRYMAICRQFCAEFGMTPSARGRMTVPAGDEDEDEDFLRGPRPVSRNPGAR